MSNDPRRSLPIKRVQVCFYFWCEKVAVIVDGMYLFWYLLLNRRELQTDKHDAAAVNLIRYDKINDHVDFAVSHM